MNFDLTQPAIQQQEGSGVVQQVVFYQVQPSVVPYRAVGGGCAYRTEQWLWCNKL